MPGIPENKRLAELARQYAELTISPEEFGKQRRSLLDEVDAKYNDRKYRTAELVEDIKNKIKSALNFRKKNIN